MGVYFLKTKDEVFEAFQKFRALVDNRPERRIKVFRTDRDGEFCSN